MMTTLSYSQSPGALSEHDGSGFTPARKRNEAPSLLACVACRSRHLKCDAEIPSCGRCLSESRLCQYEKSRRGFKGPRKRNVQASENAESTSFALQQSTYHPAPAATANTNFNTIFTAGTGTGGFNNAAQRLLSSSSPQLHPLPAYATILTQPTPPLPLPRGAVRSLLGSTGEYHRPLALGNQVMTAQSPYNDALILNEPGQSHTVSLRGSIHELYDPLLEMYYQHFHNAHPFLLPRRYLLANRSSLSQLEPLMRYIGAHYDPRWPKDDYRDAARNGIATRKWRDGSQVQALLLYAIILKADDEQDQAIRTKMEAISIALEIGMHRKEYAIRQGQGSHVREESWRRTWWELYVMDGMLAALSEQVFFRCSQVNTDVPLPCEEQAYATEDKLPTPTDLQTFSERAFAHSHLTFSSFAYRIEAMRILGTVLACPTGYRENHAEVEAVDSSITSWSFHLPAAKREVLTWEGKVDEMLFHANMIINAASIFLHKSRSNLVFAPMSERTSCTRPTEWASPVTEDQVHSLKAIKAANNIANLVSLPVNLVDHTPFFTCAMTLSAMVHLAAYSMLMFSDGGELLKQRIMAATGGLSRYEEVWPIARPILGQVKTTAQSVFSKFEAMRLELEYLPVGQTPGPAEEAALTATAATLEQDPMIDGTMVELPRRPPAANTAPGQMNLS